MSGIGSAPPGAIAHAARAGDLVVRRATPSPATLQAAREFEAVFVRKILAALEKTTRFGGDSALSAGADVYSSMMVGALADSVAASGGIGLGDLIARALDAHGPAPKP